MQQYDVTDAQKKAFEENEADFRGFDDQLRGIRETARARLAKNGWEPDRKDTIPCLVCPCHDFQQGDHRESANESAAGTHSAATTCPSES